VTEYGVLLGDGTTVAPAADRLTALTTALARGYTLTQRTPDDPEWRTVPPSTLRTWEEYLNCMFPDHRTLRRHEKAKERACPACRTWAAAYRRALRQRKAAA
jgi:hypothetical protein